MVERVDRRRGIHRVPWHPGRRLGYTGRHVHVPRRRDLRALVHAAMAGSTTAQATIARKMTKPEYRKSNKLEGSSDKDADIVWSLGIWHCFVIRVSDFDIASRTRRIR